MVFLFGLVNTCYVCFGYLAISCISCISCKSCISGLILAMSDLVKPVTKLPWFCSKIIHDFTSTYLQGHGWFFKTCLVRIFDRAPPSGLACWSLKDNGIWYGQLPHKASKLVPCTHTVSLVGVVHELVFCGKLYLRSNDGRLARTTYKVIHTYLQGHGWFLKHVL